MFATVFPFRFQTGDTRIYTHGKFADVLNSIEFQKFGKATKDHCIASIGRNFWVLQGYVSAIIML